MSGSHNGKRQLGHEFPTQIFPLPGLPPPRFGQGARDRRPELTERQAAAVRRDIRELLQAGFEQPRAAGRLILFRRLVVTGRNLDQAVERPADSARLLSPDIFPGLVRFEIAAGIEERSPTLEPLRRLR